MSKMIMKRLIAYDGRMLVSRQTLRIAIAAFSMSLAACGPDGTPTPTPAPAGGVAAPAPSPAPTPAPIPAGLESPLPAGLVIADAELRRDVDVPAFHFDDQLRFNNQPDFEAQFPRLAPWAECITKRRDHNPADPAGCFVKKFSLIEVSASGSESPPIATFDFSKRGQVECAFTNANPPVRIPATFCAGANYRRERDGQLCWYTWCLINPQPLDSDDGMVPMTNGRIGTDGVLSINVAEQPKLVSHWWTQTGTASPHPISRASQGYRYYIVMEIYTVGDAVFRVGADRWIATEGGQQYPCTTYPGNPLRENCQRFFSNWFRSETGDQAYKTLRFRIAG